MKQRKSGLFIMLAVILLAGGIIVFAFFGINGRSYELHLPEKEKLEGISVEKEGLEAEITEEEEMEDLLCVLNGSGQNRHTKEESISDAPVNAQGLLKVDFHFAERGTSTLFLFKKGSGCYMEQPYNGVYKISDEEYRAVEKYFDKQ